jgi:hypothetical protein
MATGSRCRSAADPILKSHGGVGSDPGASFASGAFFLARPRCLPLDARPSINQRSPFFQQDLLERGIGIRFKDKVRHDVEEYCISEGWIRVALGKKVDRNGNALTLKLVGPVEAWFERPAAGADTDEG